MAKRYGIADETVRKWRKRGEQACQDQSSRPKRLPWRATEEERAVICAVRRTTGFSLDDLTFVLRHFLPHLNRDSVYRVLKSEGLDRRPSKPTTIPEKGQGCGSAPKAGPRFQRDNYLYPLKNMRYEGGPIGADRDPSLCNDSTHNKQLHNNLPESCFGHRFTIDQHERRTRCVDRNHTGLPGNLRTHHF